MKPRLFYLFKTSYETYKALLLLQATVQLRIHSRLLGRSNGLSHYWCTGVHSHLSDLIENNIISQTGVGHLFSSINVEEDEGGYIKGVTKGGDGRSLGNERCCAVKLSEDVKEREEFRLSNRLVICFSQLSRMTVQTRTPKVSISVGFCGFV